MNPDAHDWPGRGRETGDLLAPAGARRCLPWGGTVAGQAIQPAGSRDFLVR